MRTVSRLSARHGLPRRRARTEPSGEGSHAAEPWNRCPLNTFFPFGYSAAPDSGRQASAAQASPAQAPATGEGQKP
ncbi:hypothetical protein GCM10010446_39470 [Streptomyces enissocaesilis]|uniref:Uncharacterized protein n=1 Tax=Streptomyces enissocaesilis TaxID=332589 RepID=A0ABN3XFR4_9ACTN